MRRREFIGILGGVAVLPVAALAQLAPKPRRLAFVHSGIPADKLTEKAGPFWVRRFYEELRKLVSVSQCPPRFCGPARTGGDMFVGF